MRKTLLVAATAALLTVGLAAPAMAADTGGTDATFTVTGGTLDITVPGAAALTSPASGAVSTSGQLGEVQVVDGRGGTAGWVASAVSTDFTGTGLTVIPAADVNYTSAATSSESGTNTVTANDSGTAIGTERPVYTATDVSGNNTAAWDPTITVALPQSVLAGDYSGTITHSVA